MAYRMTELTDYVRIGRMGDGGLDIEVWETSRGWEEGGYDRDDEPQEVVIPSDAVEAIFDYLR